MRKVLETFKSLGKDYVPGSTSFAAGFMGPPAWALGRDTVMVYDAQKAKRIARKFGMKSIREVEAGLDGDFAENSTVVYDGKKWHDYDAHSSSLWATPIIIIRFHDKPSEAFECYKKELLEEQTNGDL